MQVFQRQLAVASLFSQRADFLFDSGQAHQVRIANDRRHQAALGADGDRNIVVILVDKVRPVDLGIDLGHLLERVNHRLHEEAHEAQLHTVPLLEDVLVLRPDGHHRAHIHLVEGGQHGGVVLGLLQAPRDGLA